MIRIGDLKEFLNEISDKYLDYRIDICLGNNHYDCLEQIQLVNSDKRFILHSDYTCHCTQDGIYSLINKNKEPLCINDLEIVDIK